MTATFHFIRMGESVSAGPLAPIFSIKEKKEKGELQGFARMKAELSASLGVQSFPLLRESQAPGHPAGGWMPSSSQLGMAPAPKARLMLVGRIQELWCLAFPLLLLHLLPCPIVCAAGSPVAPLKPAKPGQHRTSEQGPRLPGRPRKHSEEWE